MFEMMTAAAMFVAASAQTPTQRPAANADPLVHTAVVLTGCIAESTEGKETRFMLINASVAAGAAARSGAPETGSTGVGTTGTGTSGVGATASPTSAQDSAQVTVLLTSDASVQLRRHVNRRVEVHGKMGVAAAPASDAPRQLHVTKLRRLSGSCSDSK